MSRHNDDYVGIAGPHFSKLEIASGLNSFPTCNYCINSSGDGFTTLDLLEIASGVTWYDNAGHVLATKYGERFDDHWSMDKVLELAKHR